MATTNHGHDEEPNPKGGEPKTSGRFVEKMFSGFGHSSAPPPQRRQPRADLSYRALPQSRAPSEASYCLPGRPSARLAADSPALDVMTDLTRVEAVTIAPGASVDEANEVMIRRGVRSLFVVDEARVVLGLVTATDILGERPIQAAQERGVRHAEVLVQQVMTTADRIETIDLQDVHQARVGDIVETLKRSGRQHALVIEAGSVGTHATARTVRGIFSLTQIARQLGLPPLVGRGVAITFAEIEAAIAG